MKRPSKEIRDADELRALAPWVQFGPKGKQYPRDELARLKRFDYGKKRTLQEWARAVEPRAAWLRALELGDTQTANRFQTSVSENPWPELSVGEARISWGQEPEILADAKVKHVLQWAKILSPNYDGRVCDPGPRVGASRAEFEAKARERHGAIVERLDEPSVRETALHSLPAIFSPGAQPVPHRFLLLNLTAPDDVLHQAFDAWLKEARRMAMIYRANSRPAGMTDIPTRDHGATDCDMQSWVDDRLLAVADYVLAARTKGKRAADSSIAAALGVPVSRVQKSLRPRALALISDEVVLVLRQQAWMGMQSTRQPAMKPRGLSSKVKSRAV